MLSRVADNLYWASRYLERAEHTARVLDLTLNILLEQQSGAAMTARMNRLLISLNAAPMPENTELYALTNALAFDSANSVSIVNCLESARENARQVRQHISSEMWEQLNILYHQIRRTRIDDVWHSQSTHNFFRSIKEGAQLFQGITDSTMSHNECWQFLQVGRFIERANSTAALLDAQFHAAKDAAFGDAVKISEYLDWVGLLKCCTAFEAYCKVHTAELRPEWIAEFLLLNSEFPHSIRFSIDQMSLALNAIDRCTATKRPSHLNRIMGKLNSALNYGSIDEIMSSDLSRYLRELQTQCVKIHDAVYEVYIAYQIETAL